MINFLDPVIQWGKRRKWLIMILVGIVIVVIETFEHLTEGESLLGSHFLTEVFIYGVLVPAVFALLMIWLERIETRRDIVSSEIGYIQKFSQELVRATSWEELEEKIVYLPKSIIPEVESTCLYRYDEDRNLLLPEASWGSNDCALKTPSYDICLETCQEDTLSGPPIPAQFHMCTELTQNQNVSGLTRFCLPLVFREEVHGLLHFNTPSTVVVSDSQALTLSRLAPEIALVLANAQLQSTIVDQNQAAVKERQRIAQDLHDTLGQNISYLRLKLDHMSSQHTLIDIVAIQQELERMRDVANQAYESVRGTLVDLHPKTQVNFELAFKALVDEAAKRMNIVYSFQSYGQRLTLPDPVHRQVLSICQEALTNIEKHSQAKSIKVLVDWGSNLDGDELLVEIIDDGIGFAPEALRKPLSLGTAIIEERANTINGTIMIESSPGKGARVSLRVPISIALASLATWHAMQGIFV